VSGRETSSLLLSARLHFYSGRPVLGLARAASAFAMRVTLRRAIDEYAACGLFSDTNAMSTRICHVGRRRRQASR
jgi:hypothetical protein